MGEQLERYRWLIVALFTVPLLSAAIYLLNERLDDPDPLEIAQGEVETDIRVYVTGAVENPGVYPLPEDARWSDAVAAAGGFAPDADPAGVNLARRVHDEDQIVVPRLTQGAVAGAGQGPLLNINTASQSQLEALAGIGEVRAARIIESRSSEGLFASIDELVFRGLIPQSVFDDIADEITVGP